MASATPSLPLNSHRGSPASLSTSTTQTPPAHLQARRQDRATFLGQVFDMVSKRPANDPTLSWSKDGKSIVIWSQGNFEQDVLPAFFPMQKKLRTFLRAMQVRLPPCRRPARVCMTDKTPSVVFRLQTLNGQDWRDLIE
ncbi:hypothetical protein C8F01DRAFT_640785 [Mycena amicta]|nr:hypothetical protein C8F01DRAFT_640785 [Mycena amicta]